MSVKAALIARCAGLGVMIWADRKATQVLHRQVQQMQQPYRIRNTIFGTTTISVIPIRSDGTAWGEHFNCSCELEPSYLSRDGNPPAIENPGEALNGFYEMTKGEQEAEEIILRRLK